jgi:hypothetical protein
MATYYFKGNTFNTNLKYYRVVRSNVFKLSEKDDILQIGVPSIVSVCEPTRKIKEVHFNYNGAVYRRKSLEDISIRIFFVEEVEELYKVETDNLLLIISPGDYSLDKLTRDLDSKLLELESGKISNRKEVDILLNKDIIITGESKLISYKDTIARYTSDMTSILDSFMDFWIDYAKDNYLTFYNELVATDYTTKELLLFSYTDYLTKFTRFLPHTRNEVQEYELPIRFRIKTASIGKFIRMLGDIRSLKFMTNIVRVECKDKIGVPWIIPIRWDPDIQTNSPDEVSSDNDVSFEIALIAYLTIYNIRDEVYHPIFNIISELGDVKLNIK